MDQTADLPIRWHLVGHLQSNKAEEAGARFDVVHSIDQAAIASRLDEGGCQPPDARSSCWSRSTWRAKPTKHGARADELPALFRPRPASAPSGSPG